MSTEQLADLWWNLGPSARRALCELAYLEPHYSEVYRWGDLPVDARIRLVRAMRSLSELALDCARAIALERVSIEAKAPPSPRDELVAGVAALVGVEPAFIERHTRRRP